MSSATPPCMPVASTKHLVWRCGFRLGHLVPAVMMTSIGKALKDSKRSSSQRGWLSRLQSPGCKEPRSKRASASAFYGQSPMICAVDSITSACHENFDASLPLIGTGHFVLWAWYLATYEAIMQSVTRLRRNKETTFK